MCCDSWAFALFSVCGVLVDFYISVYYMSQARIYTLLFDQTWSNGNFLQTELITEHMEVKRLPDIDLEINWNIKLWT